MTRRALPFVLLLLVATPCGRAQNWPQWRGPDMNGVSKEKNLPLKWSAASGGSQQSDENIAWKLPLPGFSGSTPIIWGEKIFLNVVDGDEIQLWCVNRLTGQPIWKKRVAGGNFKIRKQNMSSPSPVTDGKNVFVMTGTGVLKSLTLEGEEIWSRDIQKDYGRFGLNWGYASSPLLYGDALFVQVLHGMKTDDASYVLRIDNKTGKTVWRVERPTNAIRESPDAYTTPALLRNGKEVEIVVSGGDCVTGHDPATGKELWRANGLNPSNNPANRIVASPVVAEGMVYVPSRVSPLLAIRAGGRGDVTESHRAWSTRNGPDVPTPVTDGKYLYIVNDRGVVYCYDAKTGEEIYGGRRITPAVYSSSPVLADGKIYATNEEGVTSVIKAGPDFEVLAENHLNDYCLSSPVVSEGQIFIRTSNFLFAIGTRQKK